jgi:two-component sensor histidine kinase
MEKTGKTAKKLHVSFDFQFYHMNYFIDQNYIASQQYFLLMVPERADEAQRESKNKFRQLFTRMPGAVAIYDAVDGGEDFILCRDNGVGIAENFDWRNAKSLGVRLIISLVEQLSGTIELDRTTGTTFKIVVKEKE